jgi:hypothetical protein
MSTNETKWTPGPWQFVGPHFIGTAGDDPQTVAYLDDHRNRKPRSSDEMQANGRLIAAAPEMYEALQAEKYAQALANDPNSQEQAKVARARADDFRRAALAKAEGRGP